MRNRYEKVGMTFLRTWAEMPEHIRANLIFNLEAEERRLWDLIALVKNVETKTQLATDAECHRLLCDALRNLDLEVTK